MSFNAIVRAPWPNADPLLVRCADHNQLYECECDLQNKWPAITLSEPTLAIVRLQAPFEVRAFSLVWF